MTVVQSNGQPVEPVETDEFRIALAETYDVIVTLPEDRAYTIFAEAMDRSGFACGTLAPREGMRGELPTRRRRANLTMADMGMAMSHGAMAGMAGMDHAAMDHAAMGHEESSTLRDPGTVEPEVTHTRQTHGVGNAMVPMSTKSRLHEAGVGLGEDGWRVLRYTDLRAERAWPDFKGPTREVEIHLTGNMERYMWSIDGVPFEHAAPIRFILGERLRLTMVNDSMMNHPMHLHGMWMELENGHGVFEGGRQWPTDEQSLARLEDGLSLGFVQASIHAEDHHSVHSLQQLFDRVHELNRRNGVLGFLGLLVQIGELFLLQKRAACRDSQFRPSQEPRRVHHYHASG